MAHDIQRNAAIDGALEPRSEYNTLHKYVVYSICDWLRQARACVSHKECYRPFALGKDENPIAAYCIRPSSDPTFRSPASPEPDGVLRVHLLLCIVMC